MEELLQRHFEALRRPNSSVHREVQTDDYERLFEETARVLRQYERENQWLKEDVAMSIFNGRLSLSALSPGSRISCQNFYIYAYRRVRNQSDSCSFLEVLQLELTDICWSVEKGYLSYSDYRWHMKNWLHYLYFSRIEFKGYTDFEYYFQEQEKTYGDLFRAYGM